MKKKNNKKMLKKAAGGGVAPTRASISTGRDALAAISAAPTSRLTAGPGRAVPPPSSPIARPIGAGPVAAPPKITPPNVTDLRRLAK